MAVCGTDQERGIPHPVRTMVPALSKRDTSEEVAIVAIPFANVPQKASKSIEGEIDLDDEEAVLCLSLLQPSCGSCSTKEVNGKPFALQAAAVTFVLAYSVALVIALGFLFAVLARCLIQPTESLTSALLRLRKQKLN